GVGRLLDDLLGRIHRRVLGDLRVEQLPGRRVRAGIGDVIGDRGGDLGLEQVVDEGVRLGRVRRVLGDGDQVDPAHRAFLRDHVLDLETGAGLFGTIGGHGDVAGVAHRQAQVAIGQVVHVAAGVEVAQVRLDRLVDLGDHLRFTAVVAVGVHALPDQGGSEGFLLVVQYRDAAVGEFADRGRIEQ